MGQLSIGNSGAPLTSRPPRACYTCGEVGHLQNACPQGATIQGAGRCGRRAGTGVDAPPERECSHMQNGGRNQVVLL